MEQVPDQRFVFRPGIGVEEIEEPQNEEEGGRIAQQPLAERLTRVLGAPGACRLVEEHDHRNGQRHRIQQLKDECILRFLRQVDPAKQKDREQQEQQPGQARQQIASGDNPLAASLAELLGAVVRGDTAALKAHFSVEDEGAQQTLVPKDALLQKAISRIVVDGEPPTAIRLDEPQGGQTIITLQLGQCQ